MTIVSIIQARCGPSRLAIRPAIPVKKVTSTCEPFWPSTDTNPPSDQEAMTLEPSLNSPPSPRLPWWLEECRGEGKPTAATSVPHIFNPQQTADPTIPE